MVTSGDSPSMLAASSVASPGLPSGRVRLLVLGASELLPVSSGVRMTEATQGATELMVVVSSCYSLGKLGSAVAGEVWSMFFLQLILIGRCVDCWFWSGWKMCWLLFCCFFPFVFVTVVGEGHQRDFCRAWFDKRLCIVAVPDSVVAKKGSRTFVRQSERGGDRLQANIENICIPTTSMFDTIKIALIGGHGGFCRKARWRLKTRPYHRGNPSFASPNSFNPFGACN